MVLEFATEGDKSKSQQILLEKAPAEPKKKVETQAEVSAPSSQKRVIIAKSDVGIQPQAEYSDNPTVVGQSLQRVQLWRLLKTEFPDWYTQRVLETARQKSEGKPDKEIAQQLAEQLVALRRKHVADALAASQQHLKTVASSFLENLERLSKHSTDACYGFISHGETSPLIVELTRASEHRPALQQQSAAIFAAIAEGRRTPVKHAPPTRDDYDTLAISPSAAGARSICSFSPMPAHSRAPRQSESAKWSWTGSPPSSPSATRQSRAAC